MGRRKTKHLKNISIPVELLFFQYEPQTFRREFFPGDEKMMLNVKNSPHYKFCVLYKSIGDRIWSCYNDTDYIKLMLAWGRGDEHNKWKVRRYLNTFDSILKDGVKSRIIVLESPMHKKFFDEGYEIFHGHHRAGAAAAACQDVVPVTIARLQ